MGTVAISGVRCEPPPCATGDAPRTACLAPHRVGRTEAKPHDGTIITDKVNEMWGTDMTQTITVGEGRAYVFVAVEHANSEVVGMHAARSANRFEGAGADTPGGASVLWSHRPRRSAWIEAAVTIMAPTTCPATSRTKSNAWGSKPRPPSCEKPEGNGVAERFNPNLEGEPAVGEDLQYHRRTASRAHQVRQTLQRNLARRPARLSYPSPSAGRT